MKAKNLDLNSFIDMFLNFDGSVGKLIHWYNGSREKKRRGEWWWDSFERRGGDDYF